MNNIHFVCKTRKIHLWLISVLLIIFDAELLIFFQGVGRVHTYLLFLLVSYIHIHYLFVYFNSISVSRVAINVRKYVGIVNKRYSTSELVNKQLVITKYDIPQVNLTFHDRTRVSFQLFDEGFSDLWEYCEGDLNKLNNFNEWSYYFKKKSKGGMILGLGFMDSVLLCMIVMMRNT